MAKKGNPKSQEPSQKESSNSKPNQKNSRKHEDFVEENEEKLEILATKIEDEYFPTIFQAEPEENLFRCLVCKTVYVLYKNLKRHVEDSSAHANKITDEDLLTKHKKLLEKLGSAKKKEGKSSKEEKREQKKSYLEFLGKCFQAKLSFRQISQIGKSLKEMLDENKLDFLKTFSFKEGDISKAAHTWGRSFFMNS